MHIIILYYVILYYISYHISHRIASYRIVSYHIISYRIVTYRIIPYIPYNIYYIILYYILYYIILYYIILYYIILYYIILYYIILYYIIHIVRLLHVSATLLFIIREMHYGGYSTNLFEPMQQIKVLNFKMCGLKYISKYKIQINVFHTGKVYKISLIERFYVLR